MRVLVVGGGGREHALAWRLSQPTEGHSVVCAPGNAGIARHAECVAVPAGDVDGQVRLALEREVDLVVVGPEQPLVAGLADRLTAEGVAVLGPSAAAAQLEGSKAFAKALMERAGIPTAAYGAYDDPRRARAFAAELGHRVAVKADGLAGGKGVVLARNAEEVDAAIGDIMERGAVGEAGQRVVVEALLEGEEASFIALCDGERVLPLAGSQDHKQAYDGDRGPNTGGMGAVSPAAGLDEAMSAQVVDTVMAPAVAALAEAGHPFRGVLYAGLMLTDTGPQVLEFNVRFGDPETQPLLMRARGDLGETLAAAARGSLGGAELGWDARAAVCVVLASEGYPGRYPVGRVIEGLPDDTGELVVFHAGTRREGDALVTSGGRVLGVTALGGEVDDARRRAYAAVDSIRFQGAHYRRDIGARGKEAA